MKKWITLALALICLSALAACGTTTTTTTTTSAGTTTTTTATTTTTTATTTTTSTSEDLELAYVYSGSHTVSAMGSEITYQYNLMFNDDLSYAFHCSYLYDSEVYVYDETGTYTLDGAVLSLTPEGGSAVAGVLAADHIEVPVKASEMGSRATRTLTPAADPVLESVYQGSHTVSAMGSEVTYEYLIRLADGAYTFHCSFEMGGETYLYDETGAYVQDGWVLTLTPVDGTAEAGHVNVDGGLTLPIKASSMGSRALRVVIPAADPVLEHAYEGSHTVSAMGSDVTYLYTIVFAEGVYTFHCSFEMSGETYTYDETGAYVQNGWALSLTPEGGTASDGEIGLDGSLVLPIKASSMGSRALRTVTPLSAPALGTSYEGSHTVSAMGSDVTYHYTMTFTDGAYAFHSSFEMSGETYTYDETGTYVQDGWVVTLTPTDGTAEAGSINVDGSVLLPIKASSMAARALHTLTPIIP